MRSRFDNSHSNQPDCEPDFDARQVGDGYLVADFSRADMPPPSLSRPFKILFALTLALATWVALIAFIAALT